MPWKMAQGSRNPGRVDARHASHLQIDLSRASVESKLTKGSKPAMVTNATSLLRYASTFAMVLGLIVGTESTGQTSAAKDSPNRCPLTVEQAATITGQPMMSQGACTFFPASGRDIPHVFYVLQVPMVCNGIAPSELGFTESVPGLSAKSAYIKNGVDGAHLLVCPSNGRAFDVVVEIKNDKAQNREAAIRLARQLLATK